MPTPANLGPPARMLLEHLPPARLARLAARPRAPDLVDPRPRRRRRSAAALDAVAGVLEDPHCSTALLERMPPRRREVVELLALGPPDRPGAVRAPRGRRRQRRFAGAVAARARAAGRHRRLHRRAPSRGRDAAVRGGRAFTDVELDPPVAGHDKAQAVGRRRQPRPARRSPSSGWSRRCSNAGASSRPACCGPAGSASANLRRTARDLDVDERVTALLIEVAHAAGLIAPDGDTADSWLPTTAYDLWLAKPIADRWALLANAWLTTTRVSRFGRTPRSRRCPWPASTLRSRRNSAPTRSGLTSTARCSPLVRREVLRLSGRGAEGCRADVARSLGALLRWSWPRRGGRLRDDLVGWSHEEAEVLGHHRPRRRVVVRPTLAQPAR